jgi:hypothetical protein
MKLVFSIAAFLLFSFISFGSNAQTTAGTPKMMYVELNQLTVESYPALFHKLQDNAAFELVESCVPAKVVSIRLKNPQAAVSSEFLNLKSLLVSAGFTTSTLLETYEDSDFMNRCQTARTRP